MPQSLANVLVHIVFSTSNRVPFVDPEIEKELWPYAGAICRACDCPSHGIGGTSDHIHIVCSLSRTITVADLVGTIKRDSSKWIKTKGARYADFSWQNGYGAFSIGQSQLDDLKRYIARQREHHRQRTFQEELREILERYQVPFDERYVWG